MNEDFIPYELAVKLKEKGFPQVEKGTLAMYNEEGEIYSLCSTLLDQFEYSFKDFDDSDCVAPTISQVLKWLREEKGMYIQITLFEYCYDYCILDTKMVYYDNEHIVLHQGPTGYSYDEAALAGIKYCLDNLI